MKEKFLHNMSLLGSIVLLIASVAIIFWINQSEASRLALREQFTMEKISQLGSENKEIASPEPIVGGEEVKQAFSEMEALLSSVGSDDLPEE